MESLILAATAIAATVMTKAFEKASETTGEKLGEQLVKQGSKFLAALKRKSPSTASAIELASERPLDYGEAVLEVNSLAKVDPEIAGEVKTLADLAALETNPKLVQMIQAIVESVESQPPTTQNTGKLAEKIALVVQQGGIVSIQTLNMD
jgi:hypothetical protein